MSSEKCEQSSRCESCAQASQCGDTEKQAHQEQRLLANLAQVKHKFMVLSGKGGVGKSSVAVNLAVTLAQEGYWVGIMDADIHGPNIPKMMGVEDERVMGSTEGLLPIPAAAGVKVISIGFLLQHRDDAIVWRGPLKHSLIQQFLGDVLWGPLDYLVIDLPPGTGDEALSTAHLIKDIDGAIIVTTPQDVALLDARKSITFCRRLKIPALGVVENMSGLVCPHCQEEIPLFKIGGGEKTAEEMGIPFLGRVPLDPEMVISTDKGVPYASAKPDSKVAAAFHGISRIWRELLEQGASQAAGNRAMPAV